MNSLFQYKDYKQFIKDRVSNQRGESTRLAKACACEKSYLSRVLYSEVQITMDHAYKMAIYWCFSQEEQDYFLLLVEEARSSSLEYRKYLASKIHNLKIKNQSLKNFTDKNEVLSSSDEVWYNSSVYICAVHMLTALSGQTKQAMSKRLGIPSEIVESILIRLEKLGYVSHKKDVWCYLSGAGHLDRQSPLVQFHHSGWRNRAMMNMLNLETESIHYTNIQSLSYSDLEKLRQMILSFINESNKLMNPSKPEELICLNIDFFTV